MRVLLTMGLWLVKTQNWQATCRRLSLGAASGRRKVWHICNALGGHTK
jgi:hypothetical protein